MNLDTFALMVQTEEVTKLCASFAANALNIAQTPSLEQVNAAMKGLAYLRGLQVVVIDQDITIEKDDGSRITGKPVRRQRGNVQRKQGARFDLLEEAGRYEP